MVLTHFGQEYQLKSAVKKKVIEMKILILYALLNVRKPHQYHSCINMIKSQWFVKIQKSRKSMCTILGVYI